MLQSSLKLVRKASSVNSIKQQQVLKSKNVPLLEKLELYNKVKENKENTVEEMIELGVAVVREYSPMKDSKALRQCLSDLQQYCSELNAESERNLDERLWNYLLQSFAKDLNYEQTAIHWYNRMMNHNIAKPNYFTLNAMLKLCSNSGDVEMCHEISMKMKENGQWNEFTCLYLVNVWILNGDLEKAFEIVLEMDKMNTTPNIVTYVSLLKGATEYKNTLIGTKIIEMINSRCVESEQLFIFIINFLLKVELNELAMEECKKMRKLGGMNIVSWNLLIQTHVQISELDTAIGLIKEMQKDKIQPNSTTFTILMKACAKLKLYSEGKIIHEMASNIIDEFSVELSNTILSFYSKCGHPEITIQEANKMKRKGGMNIISWNCLIQAHIESNDLNTAIIIMIEEMRNENLKPNSTTFTILMKACTTFNLYEEGRELHRMAIETIDRFSINLIGSIVNFYTKCGHPEIAIKECNVARSKGMMDEVLWTCLIQAYVDLKDINNAIEVIEEMMKCGTQPNSTMFNLLITACTNLSLYEEGKRIHEMVASLIDEYSLSLSTSIISFYSKCGHPEIAIQECKTIFKNGRIDAVPWICLIQAFVKQNEIHNAIKMIEECQKENIHLNSTVFNILITACVDMSLYEEGKKVIVLASNMIVDFSIELSNGILSFYTKCGHPELAIDTCNTLRKEGSMNIVSWNCLIQAHLQNSLNEALQIYKEMKLENVEANTFTYVILLSACGEYVSAGIGKQIIEEIELKGLILHEEITSALMFFYSRIGDDQKAQQLFEILQKNREDLNKSLSLITYNNMLSCYAHHGKGIEARKLYKEMIEKRIEMNDQTFTIMLNAYSHSGMIKDATILFEEIETIHGRVPNSITTGAMVDCFARAGRFEEAERVINGRMEFIWWNAILGACRKFNNIELAEKAFKILIKINRKETSPYILMSNIYTYGGDFEKAESIKRMMEKNGVKKIPAIVHHEENGRVYKFTSGVIDYERSEEVELMKSQIYNKISKEGFKSDLRCVGNTNFLSEEAKLESLSRHAEKLAIAHAFVLNPNRKSIILQSKSMRMCLDCHNVMEYTSKVHFDYLRSNYSYNDSLFLKLFNSGNIAFDIDGGKYQITLAGAVSLFDYIEPESKQLLEISKEELKLFLTEGKIVFENDQIKDMKVGGVILYTMNVEIIVRDANRYHHFKDGKCSCDRYW